MLFNTVGSLTYQGCLWLITVLVVTLSNGYGDSGALAYAMTVGNMFTAIGTYSMRTYQVSDSEGEYSQQNYVAFRLITLAIGYVSMMAYAFIVTRDALSLAAVTAFLPFKFDEAFVDVLYGIDQRSERMDYIGISQFVRGVLVVASFTAGMLAFGNVVWAVLLMWPACAIVTLAYDMPHSRRFGTIRPSITRQQARSLLVGCLPLVLSTLFSGMIVSVARQYFGNVFGNDLLGRYAAVATPAVLVQAAARYLYAPSLVPLSEKLASDPEGEFVSYFRRTLKIMVALLAVMVVALSLAGPWALTLVYGESIAPYTYLFANVLVSTAMIALLYFMTDVLIICRDIRGALIVSLAAFAVTLAVMVPLENVFTMQGINYTVILSTLAGIIVAWILLKRNLKVRLGKADQAA